IARHPRVENGLSKSLSIRAERLAAVDRAVAENEVSRHFQFGSMARGQQGRASGTIQLYQKSFSTQFCRLLPSRRVPRIKSPADCGTSLTDNQQSSVPRRIGGDVNPWGLALEGI